MAKVESASVGTRKSCLGETEGALVAQRSRWDGHVYTAYTIYSAGTRQPERKWEDGEWD